jgi:hypothetical protein
MRFVQDGEDTACLANVQRVSTPLPDEVAGPARGADVAGAAAVVADGRAHAIPVSAEAADGPTGCCDLTREAQPRTGEPQGRPSTVA